MRTIYITLLDFLTLLVSLFVCRLLLPEPSAQFIAHVPRFVFTCVLLFVLYPTVSCAFGLYRIIYRYAQSNEYLRFFSAFLTAGLSFSAANRIVGIFYPSLQYPLSFLLYFTVLSSTAMLLSRILYRVYVNRMAPDPENKPVNTLIVGCGQACLLLLNEIKYHPDRGIKPIIAVDNDPVKVGRSIAGIPIVGDDTAIPAVCKKYDIHLIIIAIPSADNKQRARILSNCKGVEAEVKLLPRLVDFGSEENGVVEKLRDFTMEELLGRDPIEINHEEVASFIREKPCS